MSASAAVARTEQGRFGVMVRTRSELFAYWTLPSDRALVLRTVDLTGRPPSESLDGRGYRDADLAPGQQEAFVSGLLPGHLYAVELGERRAGSFHPLAGTGPVQTPWLPGADRSAFPEPYHRS